MANKSVYPSISAQNGWTHLLPDAVAKGHITEADAKIIKTYLVWKMSDAGISGARQTKLYHSIMTFRRFADAEFSVMDENTFRQGIIGVRSADYADWTRTDIIGQTKTFMRWAIPNGYVPNLSLSVVESVKTPKAPKVTKTPDELPNMQEIYKLIQHPLCRIQSQALIATAYWSGARISEILRLNWSDIIFSLHHVTLRIRDTKTKKIRSVPCAEPLPYITAWRRQYPKLAGLPDGDNPVFVTALPDGKSYKRAEYAATYRMLTRLEKACGVKHFAWHACRAANITNSSLAGVPDSVIKAIHWGNQNSQMMATYTLLSDEANEREMLKRAGIVQEEEQLITAPQNCPSCCALNGPGDHYCRICGYPLSPAAAQKQRMIDEAEVYVQQHYTTDEQLEAMAAVLHISKEEARRILMGGL